MALLKFEGVDKVVKNLAAAGVLGKRAADRGVNIFGLHVMSKSQQIVPFDQGDLAKAVIDEPVRNGVKVIGYDTPYAAKQHEDTALMHPGRNSRNPQRGAQGQPKYLENPLKQESRKLAGFIAGQVDKAL